MKRIFTLTYFALAVVVGSHAQSKWELIYENDAEGNRVNGNIENLIKAVKNGEEIRISWWSSRVYHSADAAFLTIMDDSVVTAQVRPIYGQTPEFVDYTITLKENLEWVLVAGTNGATDSMMSNKATGEIVGHSSRKRPIRWHVRR